MDQPDTSRIVTIRVDALAKPVRLDKYLAGEVSQELTLSRNQAQKLLADGKVSVDGKPGVGKALLCGGEAIIVTLPPASTWRLQAEPVALSVPYEDSSLLVVDKPAGMVTHPAVGARTGTLVHALMSHTEALSGLYGSERAGIVHRLDKDTSGLLIVAKDVRTHDLLQRALQARDIERRYAAIVCGHMLKDDGVIDAPIGRSVRRRTQMVVTRLRSRAAVTGYRRVAQATGHDLLDIKLETGRTHQIRVHLAHIGHPVFGDPTYRGRDTRGASLNPLPQGRSTRALKLLPRQALHAWRLSFTHPHSSQRVVVESPIPADILAAARELGFASNAFDMLSSQLDG